MQLGKQVKNASLWRDSMQNSLVVSGCAEKKEI